MLCKLSQRRYSFLQLFFSWFAGCNTFFWVLLGFHHDADISFGRLFSTEQLFKCKPILSRSHDVVSLLDLWPQEKILLHSLIPTLNPISYILQKET